VGMWAGFFVVRDFVNSSRLNKLFDDLIEVRRIVFEGEGRR
jgi:hypothetical protein